MYVCNLIAFLCCVMLGLTEARRMRKRSDTCKYGTYQHEGKTCCLCPAGHQVLHDCTVSNEPKCELCTSGSTYLDHPNNDHTCQPCKICDPNANMKVKNGCTPFSNTVCGCVENHYCDHGDQCKICKPCDRCDVVETECTETSNTVCKDTTMSNGAIAAAVLVPLLIITICLVLFYLLKQKKDKKSRDTVPEVEPLKGKCACTFHIHKKFCVELDLNPYLSEIADHLGWKVMKRVALHNGITKASIDNHECNHPNDAKEQTYGLLQDWSQKQGLYKAYPALIKTLHAIKERRTADEIKKIVEKGQAEAQP
ncbi:tumor necrosis factor receptor superfamily member 6 [Siphateles boraxobius]|uniref:tumor necrosis factor receptor superfamily member 6 n=1 Tax=Siphateles boraxobius TaxID=180520 RepID=UPI0040641102